MNIRAGITAGLGLLLAMGLSSVSQAMEVTVQGEGIPPVPKEEILIPYPYVARHQVYGFAEVLFMVDEQGVPGDFVVLRDTNPAFSRAIVEAVSNTRYEPAVVNGEPTAARVHFRNHFHFLGQAALLGPEETLPNREELEASAKSYVYDIEMLDRPLDVVNRVMPVYPETLKDEPVAGTVMVEFYVTKDGQVKAPAVISGSHPLLDKAALEAIRGWTFSPPLVDGKPVTAVARQPFRFGDASP